MLTIKIDLNDKYLTNTQPHQTLARIAVIIPTGNRWFIQIRTIQGGLNEGDI